MPPVKNTQEGILENVLFIVRFFPLIPKATIVDLGKTGLPCPDLPNVLPHSLEVMVVHGGGWVKYVGHRLGEDRKSSDRF